jgi:hypothetical protein
MRLRVIFFALVAIAVAVGLVLPSAGAKPKPPKPPSPPSRRPLRSLPRLRSHRPPQSTQISTSRAHVRFLQTVSLVLSTSLTQQTLKF